MNARSHLGSVFGLQLTASLSVLAGIVAIWVIAAAGANLLLDIPHDEALIGGLACAILHILSEILHQFGHAWAARRTGYPMSGIHLWLALGTSVYPPDEGTLPPSVHIRRALGGPMGSFLVTIVAAIIALFLRPWDQTPGWIAAFFFLDNLLTFTLGAFLPLGFTDGSTLLRMRSE